MEKRGTLFFSIPANEARNALEIAASLYKVLRFFSPPGKGPVKRNGGGTISFNDEFPAAFKKWRSIKKVPQERFCGNADISYNALAHFENDGFMNYSDINKFIWGLENEPRLADPHLFDKEIDPDDNTTHSSENWTGARTKVAVAQDILEVAPKTAESLNDLIEQIRGLNDPEARAEIPDDLIDDLKALKSNIAELIYIAEHNPDKITHALFANIREYYKETLAPLSSLFFTGAKAITPVATMGLGVLYSVDLVAQVEINTLSSVGAGATFIGLGEVIKRSKDN